MKLYSNNIFQDSYCQYDYIDIHPAVICGPVSGSIEFFAHNPANRNTFCVA